MDPLTHMAIGAAAGELVLGRKEGRWAILVGALAGALPDLDLVPALFMGPLARMDVHRGYSHSLFLALLISPILGFFINRITKDTSVTRRYFPWVILIFIAILLHIGIDCLTTYGTRIFLPFSDYRVALSSMAIVDPFFTVPLIASSLALVLMGSKTKLKRILFVTGLFVSTLYLIFTLCNKLYVEDVFAHNLAEQHHAYTKLFTTPLPFSNVLWVGVAEGADSYYMGYYSLFDKGSTVRFDTIAKNHDTINALADNDTIRKIISIAHGLYSIEKNESCFIFNDLRYGSRTFGMGENEFMFSYIIKNNDGTIQIRQKSIGKPRFDALPLLLRRMFGDMRSG
jgi:inner membrane protein